MIRGILLDFYGTIVDEDDAAITDIAREIAEQNVGHLFPRDVASLWGREFGAAIRRAHGRSFRTQRELALSSLATVLREIGSTLDANGRRTKNHKKITPTSSLRYLAVI